MPMYEYQCEAGHRTEHLQALSEKPIEQCSECGAPAQRILSAPQIKFCGPGFHNTDYGTKLAHGRG